ncbi:hypothetical protein R8Z50_14830 [Longispora sp. K20-0274]|uniref:hypothetical protein n=1 Tax=Longispora sp. K20-0274 TaxID=3088255 RepID=UPI00399BDB86
MRGSEGPSRPADRSATHGPEARIRALLAGGPGPRVVNLVGPVGSGKSAILAALADEVTVIDEVNAEADVRALRLPAGPVLVASRRPLTGYPGWRHPGEVTVVDVAPWPADRIRALAAAQGITDPERQHNTVQLAGGNPLLAAALCRALRAVPDDDAPGAVVHAAVREVLDRLASETLGVDRALMLVATVGQCDEDLLTQLGEEYVFGRLLASSLVVPLAGGLAVVEPFRTVFELALRWRAPVRHRTAQTLAAAHHNRLMLTERDAPARGERVAQSLFLAVDGPARRLFRPVTAPVRIRRAEAGDADDIARLVRRWADLGEFDRTRCGKLLDTWMRAAPEGFHLVRDRDDRAVGLVTIMPFAERTMAAFEPVLQQHAGVAADGGALTCLTTYPEHDPAARSAVFRFLLASSLQHGRLVVTTPSVGYQKLARRFGFTDHGALRGDVHGGPVPCRVFSHDFGAESLSDWVDGLRGPGLAPVLPADAAWLIRHLREALEHHDQPLMLARSPLLAAVGDPAALRAMLVAGVRQLEEAPTAADAEAGRILAQYYLERRGGHEFIAHRLHLGRATYFRRLHHGLTLLAAPLVARS